MRKILAYAAAAIVATAGIAHAEWPEKPVNYRSVAGTLNKAAAEAGPFDFFVEKAPRTWCGARTS